MLSYRENTCYKSGFGLSGKRGKRSMIQKRVMMLAAGKLAGSEWLSNERRLARVGEYG